MIALLALATAAAAASPEAAKFEACVDLAIDNPVAALDQAGAWRVAGGGLLARHCEGLAYVAQQRWIPAATAFEAAARDADRQADARAANLWTQAGNAALAGKDAARARLAFDAALARGTLGPKDLGELHLDRARARFAGGNKPGARTDLDAALKLVPADPLAWLLSATLARQAGDLTRAESDIAQAATLSPDDAQVALEAGNIAASADKRDAARTAWQAAIANAAKGGGGRDAGRAAATALASLDASQ